MARNIYQELWDLDLEHNGCTVTSRNSSGEWNDPNADVKLDEQSELSAGGADDAPNPLIAEFNTAKLEGESYQSLKSLLNNYVFNARLTEDHIGDNEVEDAEREAFLDVILQTEVMAMTLDYINGDLNAGSTAEQFRATVRKLWFDVYTNHHQNNAVSFCTGFEHIVVGESKGNPSSGGIGGYHSWTKYLFDQTGNRVDFKGFNYDNKFDRLAPEGSSVPQVATIAFTYQPLNMDGRPMGRKRKNLGGFFVGPSPELQIAMPVAAYFESINELFFVGSGTTAREKTEKRVEIHDAVYHLVLYMETQEDQKRGDRLRSFFPKFIKLKSGTSVEPGNDDVFGAVVITAMLANPVNPEEGREWVEIENRSEGLLDLTGWNLRDHRERLEPLALSIEPRERIRIPVTRESQSSMQLTNAGGSVSVIDRDGRVVSRRAYPSSRDGEVIFFGLPD